MPRPALAPAVWLVWAAGVAGLALHLWLPVFPAADLTVALTPARLEREARRVLARSACDVDGWEVAFEFRTAHRVANYMQRELGRLRFSRLARAGKLPLWTWRVRFFRPGNPVEHRVGFTPDGKLTFFDMGRPDGEEDRWPDRAEAEAQCRAHLAALGFAAADWRVVESKAETLPARLDRYFILESPDRDLGSCRRRAFVQLKGRRVAGFRHFLRAPEEATRDDHRDTSYAGFLFYLSMLTDAVLLLVAFWQFLLLFKKDRVDEATAFRLAGAVFCVLVAAAANFLPSAVATGYDTSASLWAFRGQELCFYVLGALGIAVVAFIAVAAGAGLAQDLWGDEKTAALRLLLQGRVRHPTVTVALWRGSVFALFLGGAETLFFYAGQRWGGVFLPVREQSMDVLASPLPLLFPLAIGVAASLTEESLFRLFGTSFFLARRWSRPVAYLVPSLAWAFAHSFEPVFPVYVRGLELILGGLVFTWVFLRFDLLTCVAAHYLYDVVVFGWPLLASRDPWLVANGLAPVLPVLFLALLGAGAALRRTP